MTVHRFLFSRAPLAIVIALLLNGPAISQEAERTAGTVREDPITADDREHWSFQPLVRPALPEVKQNDWVRNPIDLFILAPLQRKGFFPQPEADRSTLIRRLSFGLTGLPPTLKQIDRFLADRSPDAYSRLVDRLLGSHDYGIYWAQHWLDLARFSETDGFEHDRRRSDAWRYRDWVIDALNSDLPYDRFVQLQLAGDEIGSAGEQGSIATAFCLSGPDMPDINSQEERRQYLLNEMTATVGSVFLGLQLGCAQCHDHKYDPVSQADFYRLRAVFEAAVKVKKNKSVDIMHESQGPLPVSRIMLSGDWQRPGPIVQPAYPRIANLHNHNLLADVAALPQLPGKTSGRRTALAQWLTHSDHPLTARVMVNRIWQTHFGKGLCSTPSDFGILGEYPSHLELLDYLAAEFIRRKWSIKQLHRLIVTSATYRQASRPSISILKAPLRQQAEQDWQRAVAEDPDNEQLARFPRQRLQGEAIRDAMLAVADILASDMGGPGVAPPLPQELLSTLLKNQWIESRDKQDHHRRSIYIFARRNLRFPIFEVFDRPAANASCPQRSRSTTAPQSLLLLNSKFSLTTARHFAGYVINHSGDSLEDKVRLVYRRAYSRNPSRQELAASSQFLISQQQMLQQERRDEKELAVAFSHSAQNDPYAAAALVDFCLAIFNSSEFIYID